MLTRSMESNIEENNTNLMSAIRQENDSRHAPRDEVEAVSERVRALERNMNRRIHIFTDDLGRIRDGVPDQPRLTAPGARRDRNNHARFADDFLDEDVQSVDDREGESRAFEYYQLSRGRHPRVSDRDAYREQRPRCESRDYPPGRGNFSTAPAMSAYSTRVPGAIPAPGAVQGNIVGVQLGPRVSYLDEIRPSNPRFTHLTSYRRYSLQNTARTPSNFDRSREYSWIKNMTSQMRQVEFSGRRPIELIKWLNTFVTCCNKNIVPEGLALNIAESFLCGNALEEYTQAIAMETAINEDCSMAARAFSDWLIAMLFL